MATDRIEALEKKVRVLSSGVWVLSTVTLIVVLFGVLFALSSCDTQADAGLANRVHQLEMKIEAMSALEGRVEQLEEKTRAINALEGKDGIIVDGRIIVGSDDASGSIRLETTKHGSADIWVLDGPLDETSLFSKRPQGVRLSADAFSAILALWSGDGLARMDVDPDIGGSLAITNEHRQDRVRIYATDARHGGIWVFDKDGNPGRFYGHR